MTRQCQALAGILLVVLAVLPPPAYAHFLLNLNVRIFHIEHRQDGLEVLTRTPMPYLLADKTGPLGDDDLPAAAPFTTNAMEGERLVHFVDFAQVEADPLALGQILVDGTRIDAGTLSLTPAVMDVRIHRVGSEPPFATLDEALDVFKASEEAAAKKSKPLYVGDAVIDVRLRYSAGEPVQDFSLSRALHPGLPGQESTANLVLNYRPGKVQVYRSRGLMAEPIDISGSSLDAFGTFVVEGLRHILEGIDHILFVLCLTIGARRISSLLWRVTGFTLGHSITLSLGFFGFVPSAAWFVPTIETAIAASIVYAAWVALQQSGQPHSPSADVRMFWITSGIGLIHGLGFSFVLQNILKVTSPDIWQSLLAFNLGIEVGQVTVVLVVTLLLMLLGRISERLREASRVALSLACGAVGLYWMVGRGMYFLG